MCFPFGGLRWLSLQYRRTKIEQSDRMLLKRRWGLKKTIINSWGVEKLLAAPFISLDRNSYSVLNAEFSFSVYCNGAISLTFLAVWNKNTFKQYKERSDDSVVLREVWECHGANEGIVPGMKSIVFFIIWLLLFSWSDEQFWGRPQCVQTRIIVFTASRNVVKCKINEFFRWCNSGSKYFISLIMFFSILQRL